MEMDFIIILSLELIEIRTCIDKYSSVVSYGQKFLFFQQCPDVNADT